MKNRAKCKLCKSILESFHRHDYIACKCGEISISGGNDVLECSAKDWKNFLRVDDQGNEILVKVVDQEEALEELPKLTRKEQIEMLDMMLKNIEELPPQAMSLPINHYDFYSYLIIVSSILKGEA